MPWPLKPRPVPDEQISAWTSYYLAACEVPCDPTLVWGTDFPVAALDQFLRNRNQSGNIILSPAHALVRAVGCCLAAHPEFNRRVLARRLYEFRGVHAVVPIHQGARGPEVCGIENIHAKSLEEIAAEILEHARRLAQNQSSYQADTRLFRRLPRFLRRFALRTLLRKVNHWRLPVGPLTRRIQSAAVLVNYLGHRGLPPMRSFKPSRFPLDSCTLSVTMGPTDPQSAAAPLFVRADHRIVDAYQLGRFVADLRTLLMEPERLDGRGLGPP
jgi:hypothetical protein